jgi:hypothetical protein
MIAARFAIDTFTCPKAGNAQADYEDAWAVRLDGRRDRCRIAIADGATESSFSGLWATLLVESYVRGRADGDAFFSQLVGARRLWRRKVRRPMPWYAAEKARQGAFAAFLGLELDGPSRSWSAIAIGDCCLFHLRRRAPMRLVEAFPLDRSEQFGTNPYLVGSLSTGNDAIAEYSRRCAGTLERGDLLIFTSDALAAWLLRCHEEEQPEWDTVSRLGIAYRPDFDALIERARESGLRNDDVTLVRVAPLLH